MRERAFALYNITNMVSSKWCLSVTAILFLLTNLIIPCSSFIAQYPRLSLHNRIGISNNRKIVNARFSVVSDAAKSNIEKAEVPAVVDYTKDLKNTTGLVIAAGAFAIFLAAYQGVPAAVEFCSGYVLEYCLSVDNLFVILVLFDYFRIDRHGQEKALQYGIIGAIILRGLFIGLGSIALQQFHQVLLLFAGVLLFSSYKILFKSDEEEEEDEGFAASPLIKFAAKFLKTTDKLDGDNFFTVVDGIKLATPLLLCTVCIELTDVIFAFDSVPAIFGVTQDPLIVFSSNIFAIAGLRSLFGVLSQAVADLQYLEKAVGIILAIIAVKMGFETFDIELLSPIQSLLLVISVLGGGVGFSLAANNNKDGKSTVIEE